jgi:hypothetical protein
MVGLIFGGIVIIVLWVFSHFNKDLIVRNVRIIHYVRNAMMQEFTNKVITNLKSK